MSHWNHRLVKDVESGRLAIHEVYYDKDANIDNIKRIENYHNYLSPMNLLKKSK